MQKKTVKHEQRLLSITQRFMKWQNVKLNTPSDKDRTLMNHGFYKWKKEKDQHDFTFSSYHFWE